MVDPIVFFIASAICLTGAFGVILARNPGHSALMLVMTLFGIAVQFVAQEAHFLAAVQVIVYAGAIVVLFLFVIMLLGVDKAQNLELSILPVPVIETEATPTALAEPAGEEDIPIKGCA